jgi:hypothetical protein
MNLNDTLINSHFCIFMSVLSPDIANAVTTVLSMISQELSAGNQTVFTDQRMKLIEKDLNESLSRGEGVENIAFKHTIGDFKPDREIKKTAKAITLTNWIAGTGSRPVKHRRHHRERHSEVRSDESKSSVKTLDDLVRNNRISLSKIKLGDDNDDERESASETARRLYRNKYRSRVEEYVDNSIPDSEFDALPSKEDLAKSRPLRKVDEDASSFAF